MIVPDQIRAVFQQSRIFARQTGYLKGRKSKAVLETSFILGRGAVKDTYHLLADGIVKLVRALAKPAGMTPEEYAAAHTLLRYVGPSRKGAAELDRWDDPPARQTFLRAILADADRLLDLTRVLLTDRSADAPERERVREAADLLSQIVVQDIERRAEGAVRHDGVSRDRVVSVHDPEMRHGRKSARRRFDGHKQAIGVDTLAGPTGPAFRLLH